MTTTTLFLRFFLLFFLFFAFGVGSFSFASANANSGKESDNKYLSELRSKLQIEPITPHIDALSKFSSSEDELKGVTRLVYSKEDLEARAYVKNLMKKNGLKVREDAMGSIFGRLEGVEKSQKGGGHVVGSGSHTDAIPLSGKYDGVYGVLGAIEALGALKRAKFQPRRHLEAVMFNSEEPSRFGMACSGSRAMGGVLDAEKLETLPDVLNASTSFALRRAGESSNLNATNPQP